MSGKYVRLLGLSIIGPHLSVSYTEFVIVALSTSCCYRFCHSDFHVLKH